MGTSRPTQGRGAEGPISAVLQRCDGDAGYAITDCINRAAAAAADNGVAVAVHELVRGRISIGALADSGVSVSAINDALVFSGATFIRRTLGFDPDCRAGGGTAHRHF